MSDDSSAGEATTRRALLQAATAQLADAGVDHPRRNAEWLLADVLGGSRAALYAYPARAVAPACRRRFRQMVARRRRHEPLQYILGYEDFRGLRLQVTPAVLIPRPETEEVVGEVLHRLRGRERPRVLDVGTGSGCIALAIKHERPDANVQACDVSVDALAVAQHNATRHDLAVRFFQADMQDAALPEQVTGALDLLVSNPPYIPDVESDAVSADVRDHEPARALFTGDDPLRFYRALARHAPALLSEGGDLVVETHAHHAESVADLLRAAGGAAVTVSTDLAGRPRIACARF